MAYTPTYVNKIAIVGGAQVTVVAVDGAGVFPPIRQDLTFPGKTPAQLTNSFLLPYAKQIAAQVIQDEYKKLAVATLTMIREQYQDTRMQSAINLLTADIIGQLRANNIRPIDLKNRIKNTWVTYQVDGMLPDPVVSYGAEINISIDNPDVSITN